MADEKQKPIKVIKLFGVEVAEWERETSDGKTYHSFSFQKSYKDNNTDEWKHTSSFKLSDLPILASLILLTVGKSAKVLTPNINAQEVAAQEEDVPF